MKNSKNVRQIMAKGLLCLMCAVPMVTSCYDDSELWDKVNDMDERLTALEEDLSSQIAAMNALLSDGSTISSCKKNDDGSYVVTLSDGTKFTVLPEGTDFSALVTYTVVNGKKCWATFDPEGNPVVITDASGNAIPVSADVSVKIVDGMYCLVINGKEYVTGYDVSDMVQVFSSCTPLTDASGNVYAMTFTFGEGLTVTAAVDGYTGVLFKISNVNNTVVSEYFIDYGTTQSFLMDMSGVVDYVMQVPDGWRVKDVVEELTGETYIQITAPAEETVALGAAVADGDLKVVSVVEGGKAAVSKIHVSTDPFKTYDVTSLKANIEAYTGVQKYAYGMMYAMDFNAGEVVAKVNELLGGTSAELPAGYNITEAPLDKTLAEIYGGELLDDASYVFWALPVFYREESADEEAAYYVLEDQIRTLVLNPMSVMISVSEVTILDAEVSVSVNGSQSVYAGVDVMGNETMDEILYRINNGIAVASEIVSYSGPASEFPDKESASSLSPDTEYIVWIVPVEEGKETYSASDLVSKEFSTPAIKDGGNIAVTAGDAVVTQSSIEIPVSSEDAAMIYYAYLSKDDGEFYMTASNTVKMSKIMEAETFTSVMGTSAKASIKAIHPETTKWLYAVAIGHDGLYGEVLCKSAVTEPVSFNSLSLSVTEVSKKDDEATLQVTVEGGTATEFIYWAGYEKDAFWVSAEYCDKSRTKAQKYMAANPDAEQIVKVMRHNGNIAEDGTITITDLSMSTTYVFLVLAKDESGLYSKAGYLKFTTAAADFGEVVETGTQAWNDMKAKLEGDIEWIEESFVAAAQSMGYASYSFNIRIPTDMTAYITCFSTSESATKVADKMLEIEQYCSRAVSSSRVVYDENGNNPSLPDWYDDNGKLIQGSMLNVVNMYPHSSPELGAFTLFPSTGHSDCPAWDSGKCSNYAQQMAKIEQYCSLDYWREYIIGFGNYHYNGDPTHPYSRTLTDPENIEKIAQAYCDLYSKYYKGTTPIVYVNDGTPVTVSNRTAVGVGEDGAVIDEVTILLKDSAGNYYEPFYFSVPNYFK